MSHRHILSAVAVALLVLSGACPSPAEASGMDRLGLSDAPSSFFPGKYFEQKAQFYLKNKSYRAALEMFELSGYWANKRSQYNAAVMQFNGIGVPVDKVRGVAWFRIAAESHDDLAESALQAATAELTESQRRQAEDVWRELDGKYGNKATFARALDRFQRDLFVSNEHGMMAGNMQVYETGGNGVPVSGVDFLAGKSAELAALISEITGSVKVGAVQTLSVPDAVKTNASTTPLTDENTP